MVFVGVLAMLPTSVLVQSDAPTPRTPWGAPDLQGVWDARTMTPLERPDELADRPRLNTAEATAFLGRQKELFESLLEQCLNADWIDAFDAGLTEGGRTSLVIDPPNGKIPARTEAGQRRRDTIGRGDNEGRTADGPEDRAPPARCLVRKSVPTTPAPYNSNLRILQTPDHVVVLHEMIHEALIIPLDGRRHLSRRIAQWHGDGRAHWDGDTLVVETTNFHPAWTYQGSGPNARIIERFTRLNAETLRYEFTVDDAQSFTRPWTARFDLTATETPMYEYACHEGNRSMAVMLEGARAQDRADAESR